MRALAMFAATLALPLAAQNFVTNGDFASGLAPWIETGYSVNPGVETFDVTGLGPTSCYGASHGGQVAPGPYLPNSIKQTVLVLPGVPLEFSMDLCVNAAAGNNADAGTFYVTVGGTTEIARVALGGYVAGEFARARLTAQFVHPTGGNLDLEIFMHRNYVGNSRTPRARVTNIQLQIAPGPTFTWDGRRSLGQTSTIGGVGEANAPFAFYLSFGRTNGLAIPGVGGTLFLDPQLAAPFFAGIFDAQGQHSLTVSVPATPSLATAVLYVQGLQLTSAAGLSLGLDQFLQFQ